MLSGGGHILHGYQHIAASIELLQDGGEFGDRQRISGVVVGVVISVKGRAVSAIRGWKEIRGIFPTSGQTVRADLAAV